MIPPQVVAALAAIDAENPLPDVTVMGISQDTLNVMSTQLAAWTQVQRVIQGQMDVASANMAVLQGRVQALAALLRASA